jgi:hypothetical protein
MILYRIAHKDVKGFIGSWRVGHKEQVCKTYYLPTKEDAIQHYLSTNDDDPLEFMLSLGDYRLITVESDGKMIAKSVNDIWITATFLSIESLS